jgi:TPP-dependent pyruvate/acetoin dehydrogenase alpha subunit
LSDQDLGEMEKAVAAQIAHAVVFAESGPWEPVEDLTKDVCTPAL